MFLHICNGATVATTWLGVQGLNAPVSVVGRIMSGLVAQEFSANSNAADAPTSAQILVDQPPIVLHAEPDPPPVATAEHAQFIASSNDHSIAPTLAIENDAQPDAPISPVTPPVPIKAAPAAQLNSIMRVVPMIVLGIGFVATIGWTALLILIVLRVVWMIF
jgi:hypothetical protein